MKEKSNRLVLHGLDVVAERINKVRQKNIYDQLYVASATQIPVPDNRYDAVVAGEFIEHIAPDDLDQVIAELCRVLTSGGMLLLTTPNPLSILVRLGRDAVLKDPSHLSILRIGELKQKMQTAGFKNLVVRGSGKATRVFGEHFPIMSVYGSYLILGEK